MALTIKDIARECGHAISTVSRALNGKPGVSEETRRHICAIAEARGFVPNANARQLKQHTTNTICIVVKGRANLLFASVVEQMQMQIEQKNYAANVYYIDEDDNEMDTARYLAGAAKPLGFVFLGGNLDHFQNGFRDIHQPSVLITNSAASLPFSNLSSVSVDDFAGGEMAIHYLLDCGHRHIGLLGGSLQRSYSSRLRYQGSLQALLQADIVFDEGKQFQVSRFSYEDAYRNTIKLWERFKEMTALFAMGDVMAVGAIRAFIDKGLKVPGDISVIGFDGTQVAEYYNPRITTVCQPDGMLAEKGTEILLERIQKGFHAVHETVPCTLFVGNSVRLMASS